MGDEPEVVEGEEEVEQEEEVPVLPPNKEERVIRVHPPLALLLTYARL